MKILPSKRPFVGLRSFESSEIDIFFGREKLIGEMLDRLSEHRFLAVTGISGGGKSSLVKTGLVDGLKSNLILEAGSLWTIIEIRPHNRPIYSLAESLLNKLPENIRYLNDIEFLVSRLKRNPKDFVVFLEEYRRFFEGSLLIIIDQFEEIFRYEENGSHVISDIEFNNVMILVDILIYSSNQKMLKIYNIITIRSDYLGKCALFNGLPELINKSQFIIPRLTRDELQEAIEYPVKMHEGEIESVLTNRILNDLGHNLDQLPQMQHALMRMWNIVKNKNTQRAKLTLDLYEKNGGLRDSISQHADEIYNTLNDKEKEVCRKIFTFITRMNSRGEYIRRPQSVRDICIGINEELGVIESITKRFRKEDTSFLRPNSKMPLNEDMILDITHESIMRQWKRLKGWIKEEARSASVYKGLKTRAKRYEDKVGALIIEPDLTRLLEWKEKQKPTVEWSVRYGDDFGSVMEFLEESRVFNKRKEIIKKIAWVGVFLFILIPFIVYNQFRIYKYRTDEKLLKERSAKELAIKNTIIAKDKIRLERKRNENIELEIKSLKLEKERDKAKKSEKLVKEKLNLKEKELIRVTSNIESVEIIIKEYKNLLKQKHMYIDKNSIDDSLSELKKINIKINEQRNKLFKKKKFFLKHQESLEVRNILLKINTYLTKDIEYLDYKNALKIARKEKKIILVLVYYYDCENCVEVDKYLEENKKIKTIINKYFKVVRINKHYNSIPTNIQSIITTEITSFPTLLFIEPSSPNPKEMMQIVEISDEKYLIGILEESVNDGHEGGFLRE